jgi:hypothetical protein
MARQGEGGPTEERDLRRGRDLLRRVSRLIDSAATFDFNVGDEPGSLALAAIAAPSIAQLLRDASALLRQVRDRYESDAAPGSGEGPDPDSLDGIGALISSQVAAQEICDLAFLTGSQVRYCLGQLETSIASQEPLQMVTRADDAIRRLRRGLIPLENALGEFEGVAPPIRVWWDLEISLRIRRLYFALRRRVLKEQRVETLEQVEERLALVSRHFADARSSEIYRFLRIDDRIQMRSLYRRIVLWMKDAERSPVVGWRLWQDLTSFVQLLTGVNNRQELQEHDQRVIARAFRELAAVESPPEVVPEDLLGELEYVLGRDDDLDELILSPDTHLPSAWAPVLVRLSGELAGEVAPD